MPSLRDLDALHRLNAPTRAAATRRRRLRKAVAVLCLLAAALILTPSSPSAGAKAGTSGTAGVGSAGASGQGVAVDALKGRHLVVLPAGTPVPPGATRVDVWNARGESLIRCAPVLPARETAGRIGDVTSTTSSIGVTVGLTETQMATMVPILAESHASGAEIVVSACT